MSSKDNHTQTDKEAGWIKLRVVGHDSTEIHFRVRLTTHMQKVKRIYCERIGAQINSINFLFDGRQISDEDTPKKLEMNDDDVIFVFQKHTRINVCCGMKKSESELKESKTLVTSQEKSSAADAEKRKQKRKRNKENRKKRKEEERQNLLKDDKNLNCGKEVTAQSTSKFSAHVPCPDPPNAGGSTTAPSSSSSLSNDPVERLIQVMQNEDKSSIDFGIPEQRDEYLSKILTIAGLQLHYDPTKDKMKGELGIFNGKDEDNVVKK